MWGIILQKNVNKLFYWGFNGTSKMDSSTLCNYREGRTCDMLFFCNVNLQFRIKRENPSFHLTNVKSLGRWKILIKLSNKTKYSLFKNWREYNNSYLHISRSKNIEVKIGISTSSIYSYMLQIHQKCITYVLSHTYYLGDAAKALQSVTVIL